MNITVYCVRLGKQPNVLLTFADESIPFTIFKYHIDVSESVIHSCWVDVELLPTIKEICKDRTGKTSILNCNHSNMDVAEIVRTVMGDKVTWKDYSFKKWKSFINGIYEFSEVKNVYIEIDHPIDLNEETILDLVKCGNESRNKRIDELNSRIMKLKKKGRKRNGNR